MAHWKMRGGVPLSIKPGRELDEDANDVQCRLYSYDCAVEHPKNDLAIAINQTPNYYFVCCFWIWELFCLIGDRNLFDTLI
jgi:hypothetical protein